MLLTLKAGIMASLLATTLVLTVGNKNTVYIPEPQQVPKHAAYYITASGQQQMLLKKHPQIINEMQQRKQEIIIQANDIKQIAHQIVEGVALKLPAESTALEWAQSNGKNISKWTQMWNDIARKNNLNEAEVTYILIATHLHPSIASKIYEHINLPGTERLNTAFRVNSQVLQSIGTNTPLDLREALKLVNKVSPNLNICHTPTCI